MERFSSLVTKSHPWPVIGRTIFFTSDKNRPTRDEIYFIDFWRENLSMYRIIVKYFRAKWRLLFIYLNHKKCNPLDFDWFKKLLFSTNSLPSCYRIVFFEQFVIGQFNKAIIFKVVV